MKSKMRTLTTLTLAGVLAFGLAGCSEGGTASDALGEDGSKTQSTETTPRVSAEDPSDILPEFQSPSRIVLSSMDCGLNCSYVAPGGNVSSRGHYELTRLVDRYYAAYGYWALADIGGSTLKDEDIFDACLETILKSAAMLEGTDGMDAKGADISSTEKANVNGWPMMKVVGTFEGADGSTPVSTNFVGYTVITWFYVADNTAAKSTPLADLEDLAKRIAESYRNETASL